MCEVRGGKAKINFKRCSNRTLLSYVQEVTRRFNSTPTSFQWRRFPRAEKIFHFLSRSSSTFHSFDPGWTRYAAAEKFCEQLCKGKITINSLRLRRRFSFGAADLIELSSAVAIKSTRNFLVRSKENFHGLPLLILFALVSLGEIHVEGKKTELRGS